jgi:glycosyltransferase involved in cell wall biosynthesis
LAEWHLITSEYPPQTGGVSDYAYQVARGLAAAGDAMHVWCPPFAGEAAAASGVVVHRELGDLSAAALRRAGRLLDRFRAPRRLLVQWVPHAYGFRSMNLFFCRWLWGRAARGDRVDLVVHEAYLDFLGGTWKQAGAAVVQRLMTVIVLNAARRVWVSTPTWEARLRPYTLHRRVPFGWLPIPSNIPLVEDPAGVSVIRARHGGAAGHLVGHFGTYYYNRQFPGFLLRLLAELLASPLRPGVLLLGRGGDGLRDELVSRHPDLAGRVHAPGILDQADVSRHLSACDVLVHPYPDGVSCRRTTVMAGLLHGRPVVTTTGHDTEPLWAEAGAVTLTPVGDVARLVQATEQLLRDEPGRRRLGRQAQAFYHELFDLRHTLTALRAGLEEPAVAAGRGVVNRLPARTGPVG